MPIYDGMVNWGGCDGSYRLAMMVALIGAG